MQTVNNALQLLFERLDFCPEAAVQVVFILEKLEQVGGRSCLLPRHQIHASQLLILSISNSSIFSLALVDGWGSRNSTPPPNSDRGISLLTASHLDS